MSSPLPNKSIVSVRLTRSWMALFACTTVLFCSCKSIAPAFISETVNRRPATEEIGAAAPVTGDENAVTGWPAGQDISSTASRPSTRHAAAPAAQPAAVVAPEEFATDRRSAKRAYPVTQVGHTEPIGPTPVTAIEKTARRTMPAPVTPAPARNVTGGPPSHQTVAMTAGPPASSLYQANSGSGAPIAMGHSCPACQAGRSYPSLPPQSYAGTQPHWGKTWQYGPWPADEYICNGGDNELAVQVADDWSVIGLHEGDTVAHYDTLEGQVVVEPTNEVCLYAPRFASVRRVSGVVLHEQHLRSAGLELPVHLAQSGEAESATTVLQPVQAGRNLAVSSLNRFRDKMRPGGLENLEAAAGTRGGFLPFEDLMIIRTGQFDNSEKARLAERLQAAYTWSHDASLQVVVDNIDVIETSSEVGLQSVYSYEMPDGKSRLRMVKVASKQNAKPGETVDFTIRFDNVGDRVIGNVTVIDNLNTRLEYVADSQDCTLKADFTVTDNEHESAALRWEITEPMKVGSGGVIRFQCRVR